MQVNGANCNWGLSTNESTIEYQRTIDNNANSRIKSSTFGPTGDYLLLQTADTTLVEYKLWVYED